MPGRKKCRSHAKNAAEHAIKRAADMERRWKALGGETKVAARRRAQKYRAVLKGRLPREPKKMTPEQIAEHARELESRRLARKAARERKRIAWWRENRPGEPIPPP